MQYFKGVESERINYNDGMGHRSRQVSLLLYTPDYIEEFKGESTELCTVTGVGHNQNGKWSSSTFEITIAPGVKYSKIQQDWDMGVYIPRYDSLKNMCECLGLVGVFPAVAEEFIKTRFPKTYEKYQEVNESLQKLLDRDDDEPGVKYLFQSSRGTKRQGMRYLILDGEVWDENRNPMPDKVVITSKTEQRGMGGGSTNYQLMLVDVDVVEELYEENYGGDSLIGRGYRYDEETKRWIV